MSSNRPLILVTNDDGIFAKGIRSLVEAVKDFGEIVVIAPDSPQSGMGHAITINHPLRLQNSDLFPGLTAFSCSGTPVDCVKLGIYEVLKRKPDLLVSGINHGANTATNVLYSGTMSAAVEGALEGIPSIGFSLNAYESDADFDATKSIVKRVVAMVLEKGMVKGVCFNVNVPKLKDEEIKGIKVCRQGHSYWADRFDKREDQFGKPYYWLTGDFIDADIAEDTDLHWIAQGYATLVPTQFDMTSYKAVNALQNLEI